MAVTGKELSIKQSIGFDLVWWDKGSGGDQDGSYWRPKLPSGYFALGHCGQSGYGSPTQPMIVVKPVAGFENAIARPTDYTPIWNDSGSGADMDGSFWLPIPPAGYVACGVVANGSHSKPSVNEVVCIHESLTVPAISGNPIWLDKGTGAHRDVGTWRINHKNAEGIDANTFYAVSSHSVPGSDPAWHCINAANVDMPHGLSVDELNDAIHKYAPILHLHPDEAYLPTSVEYFAQNASVLEKATGTTKTPADLNALPQGEANKDKFQLILNNTNARSGDFNQAKSYVHAKLVDELYTDIQFWFFYAYNGHGTFRLKTLAFGQTLWASNTSAEPIGEHEGDWEHVTIRISNFSHQPEAMYLSQHGGGVWKSWSELSFSGTQPNIYSSINGHASYSGIGSNYTEHHKIPNSNWSPQAIEFFLVNETKEGGKALNCGQKYQIVNADYLGSSAPEQPSWVNFWGRWGKSKKASFTAGEIAKIILKNAPQLIATLGPTVTALVGVLVPLILPHIDVEDQDGPSAPISKGNWNGKE